MAGGPVDPREILKGVEALLGKDGELRSLEGVPKVFRWGAGSGSFSALLFLSFNSILILCLCICSLMKASTKMVSRCMYLNILLQTKSHDVLNRYTQRYTCLDYLHKVRGFRNILRMWKNWEHMEWLLKIQLSINFSGRWLEFRTTPQLCLVLINKREKQMFLSSFLK